MSHDEIDEAVAMVLGALQHCELCGAPLDAERECAAQCDADTLPPGPLDERAAAYLRLPVGSDAEKLARLENRELVWGLR